MLNYCSTFLRFQKRYELAQNLFALNLLVSCVNRSPVAKLRRKSTMAKECEDLPQLVLQSKVDGPIASHVLTILHPENYFGPECNLKQFTAFYRSCSAIQIGLK